MIRRPTYLLLTNLGPNVRPIKKLRESPANAAIQNNNTNNQGSKLYAALALIAPAANKRESPGRKGIITMPVSIKMIKNRMI